MNINFPIIELIDRLVIAKIKLEKGINSKLEYDFYNNQATRYDLSTIHSLIEELEIVHNTIWNLESELKSGVEHSLALDEIGRRAIKIRDANNKRIALRNKMAELLSDPIREIKKDHLSQ